MLKQSVIRWLLGKLTGLPPRQDRYVFTDEDIAVPMRDGVQLLTDHIYTEGKPKAPVVLIRSSYGRGALFGMMAGLIAERGFQVIAQSVRGTGGSGGVMDPMRQEQDDGQDTVKWIRNQPWFGGQLYTFGVSYLGNAAWALTDGLTEQVNGLGQVMTLSNFRDELLSFGGYTQQGTLGWTTLMQSMVDSVPGQRMQRPDHKALDAIQNHLPLGELDKKATGKTVSWWQDWVNHDDPEDPWWRKIDHSSSAAELQAPTNMLAGWQDIFLPFQIRDFVARQDNGRPTYLTIGPWHHSSIKGMTAGLRESIRFYQSLIRTGSPIEERPAVRLYLQEAGQWLDYPCWPPPDVKPATFYLRSAANVGRLETTPPDGPEPSLGYTYNPADPTPSMHGPSAMSASKRRDMSELRDRTDTLMFTSDALNVNTDVIGPVSVDLSIRSDRPHTDFFVCLCDVDKKGRPTQVSDGYLRLRPACPEATAAGVRNIHIECWPTAWRFKRSHRIALIVASGAHPRYSRNLGTGEPLATAVAMVTASQEILMGTEYAPRLNLLAAP
ncbi:MAG: CocE/NonD family hydrolase [Halioglobus sp.]|nr:CocE/NonD family hydrolase [Halioglobus sp.]